MKRKGYLIQFPCDTSQPVLYPIIDKDTRIDIFQTMQTSSGIHKTERGSVVHAVGCQ